MRIDQAKRTVNGSKPWGLVVVGIGLVLLGLAAGFLWFPSAVSSQDQAPADESVIPVEVDFKAPGLVLKDLTGQESSLEDYEGQVVLVNNWATWCPPCKEEMPALQEYYNRHKKQGFNLIAIEAGEPLDEVAQFVDDYGLSFVVWLDPESKALRVFNNYSLPSSYVIDRNGVVRMAWTGSISLQMLEKYITPLVEE